MELRPLFGEPYRINRPPVVDLANPKLTFYCGTHTWLTLISTVAVVSIHFCKDIANFSPSLPASASTAMLTNPANMLPPFPVDKYTLISTWSLGSTLIDTSWLNVNILETA